MCEGNDNCYRALLLNVKVQIKRLQKDAGTLKGELAPVYSISISGLTREFDTQMHLYFVPWLNLGMVHCC